MPLRLRKSHIRSWDVEQESLKSVFRIVIGLVILTNFAAARAHDEVCNDLLPQEAQAELQKEFPSLYPERVSDLSTEYQQAWGKQHPQECPGIAVGHFQTASKLSYAVLLVGSKGGLSGSRLMVFSQGAGGAWKATKLSEEGVAYHYEAVYKRPPGKYTGAKKTTSVRLALDGVQMEAFDSGATLYYWSNGRFHSLVTSE
jgi:hypothetical protein